MVESLYFSNAAESLGFLLEEENLHILQNTNTLEGIPNGWKEALEIDDRRGL